MTCRLPVSLLFINFKSSQILGPRITLSSLQTIKINIFPCQILFSSVWKGGRGGVPWHRSPLKLVGSSLCDDSGKILNDLTSYIFYVDLLTLQPSSIKNPIRNFISHKIYLTLTHIVQIWAHLTPLNLYVNSLFDPNSSSFVVNITLQVILF